jgi:hypothetical protein
MEIIGSRTIELKEVMMTKQFEVFLLFSSYCLFFSQRPIGFTGEVIGCLYVDVMTV